MAVAVGTRAMRHLTVVLASVAAVSLTVMSAGGQPASAQPTDTTYPTEEATVEAPPAYEEAPTYEAPTYEAPTYEAPPQAPTPAAPEVPTQAPVVTPQTQEPVVTEAPAVTPETQAPAVVTTTVAPQGTPEPDPQTTAEATPQPTPTTPMPTPTTRTSPAEATTQATTEATTGVTTGVTTTGGTTAVTTPSGSPAATTSASPASGPTTVTTPSSGASTPGEESVETTSEVVPADGGSSDSSEVTRSAELAAGVTQTPEPQRAEASPQDIKTAQQATPVKEDPPPAPPAEIDRLRDLVLPLVDPDASVAAEDAAAAAEPKVLQWQPDWVQYDQYFRPLIFNPYPEPLRVVYDVGGVPRILIIPPLGRIVTEVRDLGSYNFTALRLNPLGLPIDVAVGNFFGGGYFPGPGLPPPPPPPPVRTLTDVPVQVKYTNATYRPIVVRKVVDVGPDPAVGGAHKVLLDGATPAWGEWKQNDSGVPQFEVHQTQSFPGMEAPAEGPLPGDYDLQLVSDSVPTGFSGKDITLIIVAAIVAAGGVGAIFMTVFRGRRRRIRH